MSSSKTRLQVRAARLRHTRETLKLSKAELARRLGTSITAVSLWEAGGDMRCETLVRVAQALRVSPLYLLLTKEPRARDQGKSHPQAPAA